MTTITRWNPIATSSGRWPFDNWPFDSWFESAPVRQLQASQHRIGVDVSQQDGKFVIEASLPGFSKDDIDVTIDQDVLRISAAHSADESREEGNYLVRERRVGKFYRGLKVPSGIDTDAASTTYKDGVLRVELPKESKEQPKRLSIGN